MSRHVAWTVGCRFRQLRLIRSCIKSLPLGAAKATVAAFVPSRVDHYNSLLAGAPACLLDGLQSVLNVAARLICNMRKYDHVTPLLRDVLYSSSYHFTELLLSTCAIDAPGLIPPRLGYVYDHLRRPIFGCGG